MKFIDIVKRTGREAGIEIDIASTVSAVGMSRKIVDWCADSWSEIQTMKHWLFMKATATFTLPLAINDVTLSALPITNLKQWAMPYLYASDVNGTYRIELVEYTDFRARTIGVTLVSQRPSICAMAPGYRLVFNTPPLLSTTITGDYWATAQTLVNDDDEPNMSEDWHMAIVYKALRAYAEHEESPELQRRARRMFLNIFNEMCKVELPAFGMGANPLAWGRRDT